MQPRWRSIVIKLLFWLNAICVLLLLSAAASSNFEPYRWWPVAITGLMFPVLAASTVAFLVFWLFVKKKYALLSITALLISIPAILKTIAFHPASDFNKVKDPEAIRVLSWNVGLMNLNAPDTVTAIIKNLEILDAIRNSNADVLCLQEFLTSPVPDSHYSFLDSITRTMNYPFRYYVVDYDVYEGFFNSGTVIYSRYPFSDTSASRFNGEFLGSVLKTGIIVGKDTIDIISTRMQSLNFKHNEYEIFRKLKQGNPVGLKGSKNLFSKLKYAYQQRGEQVLLVRNLIENSNRPHIFTGDLNDIPTSYSYKEIKGKMRDAWLHHGWGPGRTFRRISPTLRIDFIFYSTHFKSLQAKRILTTGSDHYGLITDVQLKR